MEWVDGVGSTIVYGSLTARLFTPLNGRPACWLLGALGIIPRARFNPALLLGIFSVKFSSKEKWLAVRNWAAVIFVQPKVGTTCNPSVV